jgi:hypothetical protein
VVVIDYSFTFGRVVPMGGARPIRRSTGSVGTYTKVISAFNIAD